MKINDDVLKDIFETKKMLMEKNSNSIFQTYSPFFLFGTENQKEISEIIDFNGKNVLTIASSGDQYLSSVYYGANEVDIFDINKLTYYVTYLKIVSIMCLGYEEFLNFFIPFWGDCVISSFWEFNTFKKLIPYLPVDVAFFWKNILLEIRKDSKIIFNFINNIYLQSTSIQNGMPFYSSEEEYYKLQKILKNRKFPKFIQMDLLELNNFFDVTYDVIYLSNIIESVISKKTNFSSIDSDKEAKIEKEVIARICPEVIRKLNKGGVVLLSYRSNSNFMLSTDWLYNNEFFDVHIIPSKIAVYDDDGFEEPDTDLVLTYKPNKK